MKNRLLLALAIVICALVIILGFRDKNNTPAVSLSLLSITNDAAGQRVAVLSLTKHRSATVNPESVAYRIGDAWSRQPVPTNQTAEVEALTDFSFRTQGTQPMIAAITP